MSAFWGRAYPSSEESVMDNINDIIAAIEEPPETFEEYLTRYAAQVGTLVNSYIPQGSHPDMDRYLYEPLNAYSQNVRESMGFPHPGTGQSMRRIRYKSGNIQSIISSTDRSCAALRLSR